MQEQGNSAFTFLFFCKYKQVILRPFHRVISFYASIGAPKSQYLLNVSIRPQQLLVCTGALQTVLTEQKTRTDCVVQRQLRRVAYLLLRLASQLSLDIAKINRKNYRVWQFRYAHSKYLKGLWTTFFFSIKEDFGMRRVPYRNVHCKIIISMHIAQVNILEKLYCFFPPTLNLCNTSVWSFFGNVKTLICSTSL